MHTNTNESALLWLPYSSTFNVQACNKLFCVSFIFSDYFRSASRESNYEGREEREWQQLFSHRNNRTLVLIDVIWYAITAGTSYKNKCDVEQYWDSVLFILKWFWILLLLTRTVLASNNNINRFQKSRLKIKIIYGFHFWYGKSMLFYFYFCCRGMFRNKLLMRRIYYYLVWFALFVYWFFEYWVIINYDIIISVEFYFGANDWKFILL